MSESVSDRIEAFHNELLSMQRLQLPLELGFAETDTPLEGRLEQISQRLGVSLQRSSDPVETLSQESELPWAYRTALAAWLKSNNPSDVLGSLARSSKGQQTMHRQFELAMMQPMIVVVLVYLAMLYLCNTYASKLESIYAQFWETPGEGLQILLALQSTMNIWAPLVPVLILVFLWWMFRRKSGTQLPIIGDKNYHHVIRYANYADRVASMLESGDTVGRALMHVGPLQVQGASLSSAGRLSTDQSSPIAADDPSLATLPPLLQWALIGNCGGESRVDVLRDVSGIYKQHARQHAARRGVMLPILMSGTIGGFAVLGYAMSLFIPYVEMLAHIALQQVK